MRIERLRREESGDSVRVAADVTWEDGSRPPRTVFFETPPEAPWPLEIRPEAFLVAAAVPAMRHGEVRILVEGDVCPTLVANLGRALAMLRAWFPGATGSGPPRIEAGARAAAPGASVERRRALFVSGGADSLGVLARNLAETAADSPERIRHGIFVRGFDIGGEEARFGSRDLFAGYHERLRHALAGRGVDVVPVVTNVKLLDDDWHFWSHQFHGAALASVAHALAPHWSEFGISPSTPEAHLVPWGSHPELDPLYSGSFVRIIHEDVVATRAERILRVAQWPEALAVLRVCNGHDLPSERPNCGACLKCVRTMATLQAVGALRGTCAFPVEEVTLGLVRTIRIRDDVDATLNGVTTSVLRAHGHDALAAAFDDTVAEYHRWRPWKDAPPPPRWRRALRSLDGRLTGGRATALVRRIVPARPPRS